MVGILVGATTLGPAAVLFTSQGLQLLGAVAGTTGTIGAVAEGAIVGAGVVAGGTAAVAEAAVTTGITSAIAAGTIAESASAAGIAAATIAGPVGIAIVGSDGYTWDCWKPVVRDDSTSPSRGMTLRRLASHPNVRFVTLDLAGFVVENTFGDSFRLSPLNIDGKLAFHAHQL